MSHLASKRDKERVKKLNLNTIEGSDETKTDSGLEGAS